MIETLDPNGTPEKSEPIDFVPRPENLSGLRIALIENTKKNSEIVLRRIAEKLHVAYGMKINVLIHKGQRAPLTGAQLSELTNKADFAIVGVGD